MPPLQHTRAVSLADGNDLREGLRLEGHGAACRLLHGGHARVLEGRRDVVARADGVGLEHIGGLGLLRVLRRLLRQDGGRH